MSQPKRSEFLRNILQELADTVEELDGENNFDAWEAFDQKVTEAKALNPYQPTTENPKRKEPKETGKSAIDRIIDRDFEKTGRTDSFRI